MINVILGIDAAWTPHEPSGVALLANRAGRWTCVAVAPSYESFLQQAEGRLVDWRNGSFTGSQPDPPRLVAAAGHLAAQSVDLIAIDMPVALEAFSGRRVADNEISRAFGRHGCSAHSPNASRPGPLGAEVKRAFHDAGYPLLTAVGHSGYRRGLIEVYPHPALLLLLSARFRVPYKVQKSRRYWSGLNVRQRVERLSETFMAIQTALTAQIDGATVPLPDPGECSLAALKRYEDALDALICGWIGIQFASGNAIAYGDATAAVWVPRNVPQSVS